MVLWLSGVDKIGILLVIKSSVLRGTVFDILECNGGHNQPQIDIGVPQGLRRDADFVGYEIHVYISLRGFSPTC